MSNVLMTVSLLDQALSALAVLRILMLLKIRLIVFPTAIYYSSLKPRVLLMWSSLLFITFLSSVQVLATIQVLILIVQITEYAKEWASFVSMASLVLFIRISRQLRTTTFSKTSSSSHLWLKAISGR